MEDSQGEFQGNDGPFAAKRANAIECEEEVILRFNLNAIPRTTHETIS
jgi:hypothetical protein